MTGAIADSMSVWAAPISTLVGAIATAILMWASYNWPSGSHRGESEFTKNHNPKKMKRNFRKRRAMEDANEEEYGKKEISKGKPFLDDEAIDD
jgi:hypothetical protein